MLMTKTVAVAWAAALAAGAGWAATVAETDADVNGGWTRVLAEYYWEPTSLIYACYPKDVQKASFYTDGFHVWTGDGDSYGYGLEDCAIVGGVALSMLCDRYAVTREPSLRADARKIAQGLVNLGTVHGVKGFIARGICVEDGRSVCALSSRDQYTHCLHGLWRYWHSPLFDASLRADIVRVVSEVADRMTEQVTEENDWSFQQAVGSGPTRGICKMRFVNPHESARLTMFYAVAWDIARKDEYRALWRQYLDEGLEGTLRLKTATDAELKALDGQMPPYTYLQMQTSLEVLEGVAENAAERSRVREAMQRPAELAAKKAKTVLSSSGSCLCSCAELSLAQTMTPGFPYAAEQRKILLDAIAAEPFATQARSCRIVHLAAAWWRARARGCFDRVAAGGADLAADVRISEPVVRQRRPWSRLVDVSFAVTGVAEGTVVDLKPRFTLKGRALAVPAKALSGEWRRLGDGYHRFSLDPELVPDLKGRAFEDALRVALAVDRPAPYAIVDLEKAAGEEGQVVYVTEEDFGSGRYGTVETNKFGLAGLAWTAVTNDATYKTTQMVFRHVPRGTVLDANGLPLTVADDFYISVYETTYQQVRTAGYTAFTPGFKSDRAPAVNGYDLKHLIGENEDCPPDCCLAAFRAKTGLDMDLPTCEQWEYACRAGSNETTYYDNRTIGGNAAVCTRFAWCASSVPKPTQPQEVGLLECNAWGLYDMLGNACEWCKDKNGTTRYRPGGAYYLGAGNSVCSDRKTGSVTDGDGYKMNGFRLIFRP